MSSYNKNINEMIKELFKTEEEINGMINKPNSVENGFKEYGLIKSKWLENYIKYLNNSYNNQMEVISFSRKDIFGENDLKDYSYIDKSMQFSFISNFSLVSKKALFLISEHNNNEKEKNDIKNFLHYIIIGGGCIIKRDFNGKAPYSHIILYKENKNNNIDYIIKIEEKKRREEDRNYILKNNIWNYLKKIDYKEEDEYKEIYDDKKKSLVLLYVMEIQKE